MNVLANLRTSTDQLLLNIQTLEQKVNDIDKYLKKSTNSKDTLDSIRKALRALPKKEKSQLETQQEWDMKKLYAEVLKLSYKRNDLRAPAQKVSQTYRLLVIPFITY